MDNEKNDRLYEHAYTGGSTNPPNKETIEKAERREWWLVHRKLGYTLAFTRPQIDLKSLSAYSQTLVISADYVIQLERERDGLRAEVEKLKNQMKAYGVGE